MAWSSSCHLYSSHKDLLDRLWANCQAKASGEEEDVTYDPDPRPHIRSSTRECSNAAVSGSRYCSYGESCNYGHPLKHGEDNYDIGERLIRELEASVAIGFGAVFHGPYGVKYEQTDKIWDYLEAMANKQPSITTMDDGAECESWHRFAPGLALKALTCADALRRRVETRMDALVERLEYDGGGTYSRHGTRSVELSDLANRLRRLRRQPLRVAEIRRIAAEVCAKYEHANEEEEKAKRSSSSDDEEDDYDYSPGQRRRELWTQRRLGFQWALMNLKELANALEEAGGAAPPNCQQSERQKLLAFVRAAEAAGHDIILKHYVM